MQLADRGHILPTSAANNHGFTLIIAPLDPSIRALFTPRLSSSSCSADPLPFCSFPLCSPSVPSVCGPLPFQYLCLHSYPLCPPLLSLCSPLDPSIDVLFHSPPLQLSSVPCQSPQFIHLSPPHKSRKMGSAPCGCLR